jgi:glycosyltransferase involved in cell wall biosynthesis
MFDIIYPTDWQTVGARPVILISGEEPGRALEVFIISRDDCLLHGLKHARELARVPLQRGTHITCGQPDRLLPDGIYLVCTRDPDERKLFSATGIVVDERVDQWESSFNIMLEGRLRRQATSGTLSHTADGEAPLFSVITTVYNTDPQFFEPLVQTILGQMFGDFEWLLLDNGSERTETIHAIEKAARADVRIKYLRVEKNLHIVRGNRLLLEKAKGRYIIPVDSDDLVYPDALAVFAQQCLSADAADIYYSDEQTVTPLGAPNGLIWRPSWSRLYAMATCPAAHLVAYRRDLGLAAGAYTEEYARGSHDWDTMLRLVDAGARPVRIQEVLYGWRMHPESSSMSEDSKDYLASSQQEVVRQSLRRRGLDRLFTLERAHGNMGYYHIIRKQEAPKSLTVDFVLRPPFADQLMNLRNNLQKLDYPVQRVRVLQCGVSQVDPVPDPLSTGNRSLDWIVLNNESELGTAISDLSDGVFAKAVIDCRQRITDPGWAWDSIGTLELDSDSGIVTGPIMDGNNRIASIGYFAGLDGFFGTPCPGQQLETAYGAIGLIRRHVTAAHSGFMVIRGDVIRQCGGPISVDGEDALYGIEFCLRCFDKGIMTAYTPRMSAVRHKPFIFPVGSSDVPLRDTLAARYGDRISVDPYYSRYLVADSLRFAEIQF